MKTTTVIRFATLVTALVTYAIVDVGGNFCNYVHGQTPTDGASKRLGKVYAFYIMLSFINFGTLGGIIVTSSIQCKTIDGTQAISFDAHKFIKFIVKNGLGVSEHGVVMNTMLTTGKWEVDGRLVTHVNNVRFDRRKPATFSARSCNDCPHGVGGSFEIHENRIKVAIVNFKVPFWGENQLETTYFDGNYACSSHGMTSSGSPTVEIICHKRKVLILFPPSKSYA